MTTSTKREVLAKIADIVINDKLAIRVELIQESTANVISLWQLYKNESGEWAYKGTKGGATAIRIPMSDEVADTIAKAVTAFKAVHAKNPPKAKAEPVTTKSIEELLAEMPMAEKLALLAKLGMVETKPESKPTSKAKPSKAKEDELILDLENIILNKATPKRKK